ncbi:hypothetical protein KIN20_030646 [Parelaphostrongylus tenuis]|uniref:Uncharacterized protein n=1 Tax=Parelaphostrongylus tenuis TaxID=148309 RepID=A0AAD5WH11_PARTN|nr:hypothetical protein KIN20_030646 [Parelaphostrongylus tenuis]
MIMIFDSGSLYYLASVWNLKPPSLGDDTVAIGIAVRYLNRQALLKMRGARRIKFNVIAAQETETKKTDLRQLNKGTLLIRGKRCYHNMQEA